MMKRKMLFMLLAVVLAVGSAQAFLVGGIDFDVIGEGGGSVTVLGDTLTLDGIQGVWDDNYTYANATIAPIDGDSLVFDLTLRVRKGITSAKRIFCRFVDYGHITFSGLKSYSTIPNGRQYCTG